MQIVNEHFLATISSIFLPPSLVFPLSPLFRSLSLWHHCLAWQNGKIISFGDRCGCVFMATLALTWQTHLSTNAHAPTHFHTRVICGSVALGRAPAHTQTVRQNHVGCGNASFFNSWEGQLTFLPGSAPCWGWKEWLKVWVCVCVHPLSPVCIQWAHSWPRLNLTDSINHP